MRLGAKGRDRDRGSGVQSSKASYARGPVMRMKHAALLLTAGFLLMPTLLWSQFPGGGFGGGPGGPPGGGSGGFGGGPGGPGGFGGGRSSSMMMQLDPDMAFNILSEGKDVIQVDQLE